MPYYTFNIYSTKKDVLTKQFTTQDCLDLHYLLANRDYVGVDIFCQLKFEEYSNVNAKLDSFDKFLYLLSQKILSHSFDTSVIHSNSESNSKITKIISLVKIYNEVTEKIFKLSGKFVEGSLEVEYTIPQDLSCSNFFNYKSVKLNKEIKELSIISEIPLTSLPVELYNQLETMQLKNSEIRASEYFSTSFLKPLTFSNESFLFLLTFIYSENVVEFLSLSYTLNKNFNISFEHIKSITMRELYMLVDTVNKSVQDKNKK